ncbi:MAG: transcriptional repressor LexA [Acidobacteria bacterium]|nr:transcriptional repressor LexA [Acidobacteriota bacterium]
MDDLTPRQQQVLRRIQRAMREQGSMPSVRQLAQWLNIKSPNGVMGHLRALERKGYLHRQDPQTSSFQLPPLSPRGLPLLGTIPAGTPHTTYPQSDQFLNLDTHYFGQGDLVAVQVSGESMAGDAIADGDIAIIQPKSEAAPHEIAAVRVGTDEVTLKRVRLRGTWVELIPSNPNYPVRLEPADQVSIIGILRGIIRRT